jgi:general secretion pathway protein H
VTDSVAENTDREKRSSGGFTLLELLIVLFLAVLIVGMGFIAMMNRLPSARLDAATREISATMRHARALARAGMVKQTVLLDLDGGSYGIGGKPSRRIPEEVTMKVEDPVAGEVEKGSYCLTFSPSSGISGGAVTLEAGGRRVLIRPDPVAGFFIERLSR